MDYSKAFDTIHHSTLLTKFCTLDLPDTIDNWFINYFKDRGHVTSFAGVTSKIVYINASVVQGYMVSPAMHVVFASDPIQYTTRASRSNMLMAHTY